MKSRQTIQGGGKDICIMLPSVVLQCITLGGKVNYTGIRACDITGKGKCQGGRDQVKVRTTDEEQYSQKKDSTDAFRLHLLHGL